MVPPCWGLAQGHHPLPLPLELGWRLGPDVPSVACPPSRSHFPRPRYPDYCCPSPAGPDHSAVLRTGGAVGLPAWASGGGPGPFSAPFLPNGLAWWVALACVPNMLPPSPPGTAGSHWTLRPIYMQLWPCGKDTLCGTGRVFSALHHSSACHPWAHPQAHAEQPCTHSAPVCWAHPAAEGHTCVEGPQAQSRGLLVSPGSPRGPEPSSVRVDLQEEQPFARVSGRGIAVGWTAEQSHKLPAPWAPTELPCLVLGSRGLASGLFVLITTHLVA